MTPHLCTTLTEGCFRCALNRMGALLPVRCVCPDCHGENFVEVYSDDIVRWKAEGAMIQDAFPYLDEDERELLMTGICPPCWDKILNPKGKEAT